jgi:hypothetical protein
MKKIAEIVFVAILMTLFIVGVWWSFSRTLDGKSKPIVDAGGDVRAYTSGGQQVTVSRIVFADENGKATLVINAGPPPTLEITDAKGKRQVLDLPKLAASANRWLGEN